MDYYNNFDPDDNYQSLKIMADRGFQSNEMNVLQSINNHRITGLANAIFSDGDVIRGGELIVDHDTSQVRISAATVYAKGWSHDLDAAVFDVSLDAELNFGVLLIENIITEKEDAKILNPAQYTEGYLEAGAHRVQVNARWAKSDDIDVLSGDFFAIFRVVNGVHRQNIAPPQFDAVTTALARYDAEINGSYIVEGLSLIALNDAEKDAFSLSQGIAYVDGYRVSLPASVRIVQDKQPDLQRIESEAHRFEPDQNGEMRINLHFSPLVALSKIDINAEKTVNMTHGGYAGAKDILPDTAVLSISSITQGSTVFVFGQDFKLTGSYIDWSLSGDGPSPGSSYQVVYEYRTSTDAMHVDELGFTIKNAVEGTLVLVDYERAMPRHDILTIDKQGLTHRHNGISHTYQPSLPTTPNGELLLAEIYCNWLDTAIVKNNGVRAVSMSSLESMQQQISALFNLVSQQRLAIDATAKAPTAISGLFVDPFYDDMRDAGISQTAAIIDGELVLAVRASVFDLSLNNNTLLPYDLSVVVSQTAATSSMKINPYAAFEPMPAAVTLTPAIDQWTNVQTQWLSSETRNITRGSGNRSRTSTNNRTELVSRQTSASEFLRVRQVLFEIKGFGAGEQIETLNFDGMPLDFSVISTSDDVISGQFDVPENIPVGTKLVEFLGADGSFGDASYTGQGNLTIEQRRNVQTIITQRWWSDPLSQTFILENSAWIGGVVLRFAALGSKSISVQIRGVENGNTAKNIHTLARIEASDIALNIDHEIRFEPVYLNAGVEYAIVAMTDDADHALAIAELGKYDRNNGWVTSQPYQIGVLSSSSNNSTWTHHQDKDLYFKLLRCEFNQYEQEISAGFFDVENLTDVLIIANAEINDAVSQNFWLLKHGDQVINLKENQSLSLSEKITGTVEIALVLKGDQFNSPMIYQNPQIVFGTIEESGDYISRAFDAKRATKATIRLKQLANNNSGINAYIQTENDQFAPFGFVESEQVGDGWEERVLAVSDVSLSNNARIKIELSGDTANRPRLADLRAIATNE